MRCWREAWANVTRVQQSWVGRGVARGLAKETRWGRSADLARESQSGHSSPCTAVCPKNDFELVWVGNRKRELIPGTLFLLVWPQNDNPWAAVGGGLLTLAASPARVGAGLLLSSRLGHFRHIQMAPKWTLNAVRIRPATWHRRCRHVRLCLITIQTASNCYPAAWLPLRTVPLPL